MTTTPLPPLPPQEEGEGSSFIDKLRALASKESVDILACLASHKPTPVPVHVISEELGMSQRKTSGRIARLHKVHLVKLAGRRRGYFADTAEIEAVIGSRNYKKITQDLQGKENAPGQSQG